MTTTNFVLILWLEDDWSLYEFCLLMSGSKFTYIVLRFILGYVIR